MGRKPKFPPEIKIDCVERILQGKASRHSMAKELGAHKKTIQEWIAKYKGIGPSAFYAEHRNMDYDAATKKAAVEAYLAGNASQLEVVEKYALSSPSVLAKWVAKYNAHEELKPTSGGFLMSTRKTRSTTQSERYEIVNYCLANNRNYAETAIKYDVTYQNVYQWVKKYEALGEPGLEDRRGKKPGNAAPRTPEEEMKARIAKLEAQNRILQMENDLLKKVEELSRNKRFR